MNQVTIEHWVRERPSSSGHGGWVCETEITDMDDEGLARMRQWLGADPLHRSKIVDVAPSTNISKAA